MGKGIVFILLGILFWYGIFVFFTAEPNLLIWGFWTKFWFLIIVLSSVGSDD